jgi:hypothetical protein
VDVLLAASLLLFVAGLALLIVGRWRAVTGPKIGSLGSRARSMTSIGLAAAAIGALLLIAFVAIAMTMAPEVAA